MKISPINKGIVRHLQAHGRCTFAQLGTVFKESSRFRINGNGVLADDYGSDWLRARLVSLRKSGFIHRVVVDDVLYYEAMPGVILTGNGFTFAQAPANAAPPRRMDVMHGPQYQPSVAVYRKGSLDFAACPSVRAGRIVPFKPTQESEHG